MSRRTFSRLEFSYHNHRQTEEDGPELHGFVITEMPRTPRVSFLATKDYRPPPFSATISTRRNLTPPTIILKRNVSPESSEPQKRPQASRVQFAPVVKSRVYDTRLPTAGLTQRPVHEVPYNDGLVLFNPMPSRPFITVNVPVLEQAAGKITASSTNSFSQGEAIDDTAITPTFSSRYRPSARED